MSTPERRLPESAAMERGDLVPHDGVLFVDRGVVWRVRERRAEHDPGARGASCLVFVSEGIVRRVWRYPDDWRSLSTPALAALCGKPY